MDKEITAEEELKELNKKICNGCPFKDNDCKGTCLIYLIVISFA